MALILRDTKGVPLTYGELDGNFTFLSGRIDSLEVIENSLGNITGAVAVNLNLGTFIIGTLTAPITLSFTNPPTAGIRKPFVLSFTGVYAITFPVGTKFVGGEALDITGPSYDINCMIDSAGVVTVYGVVDTIAPLA